MIQFFGLYLRERFRPAIFGPAIALHVTAALWANGTAATVKTIVQAAALITLLMIQFRLWDDLEDCERDRLQHPDRLLTRMETAPFRRALVVLSLLNVALVTAGSSRIALAGLALLDLIFWLAYRRIRPQIPDFVWRFQILLFKYPVFVVLAAAAGSPPKTGRLTTAALGVYACACAYEALHERRTLSGATS
jgi:hypothetical protein